MKEEKNRCCGNNCISIIVLARGKGSKNWAIVVVELRRFYTKLTRVVEVWLTRAPSLTNIIYTGTEGLCEQSACKMLRRSAVVLTWGWRMLRVLSTQGEREECMTRCPMTDVTPPLPPTMICMMWGGGGGGHNWFNSLPHQLFCTRSIWRIGWVAPGQNKE